MNYKALKGLLDTILQNYSCPTCHSHINDINIDVIGAAGNTVNIDIECSKCGKHSMVKSEVLSFDLTKFPIQQINIDKKNLNLSTISSKINKKTKLIKDEDIVDISKELKTEKLDVAHFFSDTK